MGFIEDLGSVTILRQAWESVAAKRGMAGIDRVSIEQFGMRLEAELGQLAEEIRAGSYRSLPVLRIRPLFLAASERALVVPAVRDRVVQRAIADLLVPKVDPTLSPSCRAFRKGSSAQSTASDVGRWIEQGEPWVLRADVKSFFDTVQPDLLRQKLAPFVDAAGLRFLDRILRCRIFDHDQVSEMVIGIPQGAPLSPLLGNLYLSELDSAVAKEHPKYVRYCDDLLVLGPREDSVRSACELIVHLLEPLGLTLNEEKTRLCRAEDGFVFLGYHFGPTGRGPAVKAVEALRYRLEEMAAAEEPDADEIDALYRGWTNYFGRHRDCWTGSAVGVLALLRNDLQAGSDSGAQGLVEARWKLSHPPPPKLGLALAEAWSARGLEEQSWLELAAACRGSRSHLADEAGWARLLRVEPGQLIGLARRLVGSPAEQLTTLSEALAEISRYDLASRLAGARASFGERAPEDLARGAGEPASEADIRLLESWFQGREGSHATEVVDRAGRRSFVPVHRPILAEDWRAHLRGERTLALPLVRTGDIALLGVLDVDLEKRVLEQRPGGAEELLGRALGTALKLRAELERRGCSAPFEFSGHKGYHLWIRFQEPVPCYRLRRWLLEVVSAVGPLPEGVRVEEFPNRDRVRSDALGPLVKLPLGVHAKTGKRCALLDARAKEIADPFEALRGAAWVSTAVLASGAPVASEAVAVEARAKQQEREIGPKAKSMLENCHVLGYLARKAERTSYLNHRERWSLLCALGHLGEEGKAALHAIISYTYNFSSQVTDRQIARLPPWPISCPKLRELHPEAVALGVCKCQFELRGKAYPTPVLYALKASEIPVFRKPRAVEKEAERRPSEDDVLRTAAEDKVRKIAELKRHRRGIEASLDRLHAELAELFDGAGMDALQLSTGVLRRIKKVGGEGWDFVIEV